MARFYKGIGVGTFLHAKDLRVTGIAPRNPGAIHSNVDLMFHVARGTTVSPYVSLTRSFGVARDYAIDASRTRPSATQPAYVYSVDIAPSHGVTILDPTWEVAKHNGNPFASPSYQHDGAQSFLLGVVDPVMMGAYLSAPCPQPRIAAGGTVRAPNLSLELETMVRALRDSELVVVGNIPRSCVSNRFDEY